MRFKILILSIITTFGFSYTSIAEEGNDFEIYKNLELFELVYKTIDLNYVDEPNPGHLMKTAIDAMLMELDPYSTYFPESLIEDFKLMTTGHYGGIGAAILQVKDHVIITDPFEGFPAEKSGVFAGDIIIEIDGQNVEGLSSEEVSDKLKGKPGSEVVLKLKRNGSFIEKTLMREEVKMSSVPYQGMIDDEIGYIKLSSFTKECAQETLAAFSTLKKNHGMKKLIFDLRGNPGGLLVQAVQIVNMWIPKGEEIVEIRGRNGSDTRGYTASLKPVDLDMPIVILIDGNSASASEIVSGALQDLDRAVIVGQTSFGKGLVQRPLDLKYNAKMKITIAKYYTPSGRCIQKLDYTNRKMGTGAQQISNEQIHKFKTRNGREVIDGRGVEPDVEIRKIEYSRLTEMLVINNIIFDFATKFRLENESIGDVNTFEVTDEIYSDFMTFVATQDFEYTTKSGEMMEQLKDVAIEEGFFNEASAEYNQLFDKFKPSKDRDLVKFKDQIITLLEDEIVGRYYFQKGRIQHSLVKDPFITESIKILNDLSRYNQILNIEE